MSRLIAALKGCLASAIMLLGVLFARRVLIDVRNDFWLLAKIPAVIALVVVSVVALDSSLGYFDKALFARKPVEIVYHSGIASRPKVLRVILPGYNQDGGALVRVLRGAASFSGDLVTYHLPRDGFDQTAVVRALRDKISLEKPDYLDAYVESAGGLDLAQLLRQVPELHIRKLVLNAAMGSWRDVNVGPAIHIFRLIAGGPLLSTVLGFVQRSAVASSPSFEPGADYAAAVEAEQNSLGITGPQAVDELRRMSTTPQIKPNEFAGRVDRVVYLRAPGRRDAQVRTAQAARRWRRALGSHARFEVVVPPNWSEGDHVQTPEKPSAAITAILG